MKKIALFSAFAGLLVVAGGNASANPVAGVTPADACGPAPGVSMTRHLAEKGLAPQQFDVSEMARSRCRYKCRCKVMGSRIRCTRIFRLTVAGRLCSRALGRAKLKARVKCRRTRRKAIGRCFCTFKKIWTRR